MSTTIEDKNVEDFLDRVRELDESRKLEDELRRRRLKEEVALKKKRLSGVNPQGSTRPDVISNDFEIKLAHPVLKQNPVLESSRGHNEYSTESLSYSSSSPAHTPSLYKYKDTLDVDKTIQRLIGRKPKPVPTKSQPRRIPSDSSIIVIDSSSDDDDDERPSLPARREEKPLPPLPKRREEETPPKLPIRKEQQTTAKPELPKKKISHFDSISQKKSDNQSGVYIPRPNSIAVMSATAAAKAPQLMRKAVDSSLGERSPDLKVKAKFLSASAGSRITTPSSSPRKVSAQEEEMDHESPSRITRLPSPQKSSWLNSALSNSGTTKQAISSTETKIKVKPLIPNKPNSLIINSEKLKEKAEREAELAKSLAKPALNHLDRKDSTKIQPSIDFKVPELKSRTRKNSNTIPSKSASPETSLETEKEPEALTRIKSLKPLIPLKKLSYEKPEALQTLARLKSSSPVHKQAPEEPEALKTLTRLKSSSPVRKPVPEAPEALQKAGKLKPVIPTKKPSSETLELLTKLSSLKKNENSPMKSSPTRKNFEQDNLNLLQSSMSGLKKANSNSVKDTSASRPILPRRTHTETTMAPVRLPFTDPNAKFPTLNRPKTFDSSELSSEKESNKLNHVTKTRTKGPKRRLPKNLSNGNPPSAEQTNAKKAPPIKSSSRVVSNKLEKRIFSNSELFI